MFWTRNWGYVSSREELAMLNRAERTRRKHEHEAKLKTHLSASRHRRGNAWGKSRRY